MVENIEFDDEIIIEDFSRYSYYKNLNTSNSIFIGELFKPCDKIWINDYKSEKINIRKIYKGILIFLKSKINLLKSQHYFDKEF